MNLFKIIPENPAIKIQQNVSLTNFSTTKLRANGNILIVHSLEALKYVLPLLKNNNIPYKALGLGSNQILSDNKNLVFIKLKLPFEKNYLSHKRETYHLPASLPLAILTQHAKKFNLKGWECMTGIPATVGGAAYMNAGISTGEFGDIVDKVYLIKSDGEEKVVKISPSSYGYRKNYFTNEDDIIFAVDIACPREDKTVATKIFDYLEQRSQTQPWKENTCGCVFKNISKTCRAGHSIDILNLKGLTYRGVHISRQHGNFFINNGNALATDFIEFVLMVQDELYLQFGKKFEKEIEF